MKKLKNTVTIDCKKWARVNPERLDRVNFSSLNMLRHPDGAMCCLGFVCSQIFGIKKQDLLMSAMPMGAGVMNAVKIFDACAEANDQPRFAGLMTEEAQRAAITKKLKRIGITVKWKNVGKETRKTEINENAGD